MCQLYEGFKSYEKYESYQKNEYADRTIEQQSF